MNYSLSYEGFEKDSLYNTVRKTNFVEASDYLQGIKVVRTDYKALWHRYKAIKNVVFLVDPPYLSTDTTTYKGYWNLKDYLKVLDVLSSSYFYFTSDKSQIVELCEWVETKTPTSNPFHDATCTVVKNNVSHTGSYNDIMYHLKK